MLAFTEPSTAQAASLPGADTSPQRQRSLARAAQQDILRRLMAPLRHDMVVPLQSLAMVAEALSARIDRGAVEGDDLHGSVSRLNRLSRQAVANCLEVCTWVAPGEDDTAPLHAGVADVVRLLTTSLNFRGFELHSECAQGPFDVSRGAIRFLLAAAILTLADTAPGPGQITVRAELSSTHGVVAVDFLPQAQPLFTQPHESGEAPLAWNEVQALAQLHQVDLQRNEAAIVLRLPRARVTAPLAMVPV